MDAGEAIGTILTAPFELTSSANLALYELGQYRGAPARVFRNRSDTEISL